MSGAVVACLIADDRELKSKEAITQMKSKLFTLLVAIMSLVLAGGANITWG